MAAPKDDKRFSARLVAVAAFGLLLLLPPILAQFDRVAVVLGVPLLWAYLFLVWAAIIGVVAVLVHRSG